MAKKKLEIKPDGKLQDIVNYMAKGYVGFLKNRYGPDKAKEVHQAIVGGVFRIKKATEDAQTTAGQPSNPAPNQEELDELQKLADLSELEKLGEEEIPESDSEQENLKSATKEQAE